MARRADRGSVSMELAILLPGFIALTLLAIMFGRQTIAQSVVDLAAHDAARAASLARTSATALTAGKAAAQATMTAQNAQCTNLVVNINVSAFLLPVGQPGSVIAQVICVVPLSDLAMPGMPGHFTITANFTSPLDTFRGRS